MAEHILDESSTNGVCTCIHLSDLLSLTLGIAAGLMLFIIGEIWTDSRSDSGVVWSSFGLLLGVVLALLTSIPGGP